MIIRRVEQREDGSIVESSVEADEKEDKTMPDDEIYMMITKWIKENFTSIDDLDKLDARLEEIEKELKEARDDWQKIPE